MDMEERVNELLMRVTSLIFGVVATLTLFGMLLAVLFGTTD